ncbi:MAG: DegT/DnrJ/EryC1/StrS family aminotransferase [Planctomycetota bacterium]|nr:MAG: DegT/DnrJ/EryC1/StrS family aminotransferase [Planctomycetota bacterium]
MSVASSQHLTTAHAVSVLGKDAGSVPLLDVNRQYQALRAELDKAISSVCESGRFVLGPECDELEKNVAAYCQAPHAVACASGSDALLLALMACDIGPGDEVLMPSFTFFATASAAWRLGAKPVFVDIDPATFNLNPELLEGLITPHTKAILPVHLFGQCADMPSVMAVAKRHGIFVVEDAAQAIGAEWEGRRAGSFGAVGCFSFYPTKNLGGFGDGGMMTATGSGLESRLRLLRAHGMQPRYCHHVVGINSRLDTLQAAVLNVKLRFLEDWIKRRQANAARYDELFAKARLTDFVSLPVADKRGRHVWNQYTIRVPDGRRDTLRAYLGERNIGTEIYYPIPLHLQQCFAPLGYEPGSLPETERAAEEVLALPIFPELTAEEQRTVVTAIAAFYGIERKL